MNAPASMPLAWSRGRWWGLVLLVTVAQVAAISWLSERKILVSRRPDSPTTFHLIADAPPDSAIAQWLNLEDPTLFALPDPRGFSGPAWMTAPTPSHQSRDWTEPQRWLSMPLAELGATLAECVRTNAVGPRLLPDKPAPRLSQVVLSPVPLRAKSAFRIEGDLAGRELLTPLEVPSIAHTDILASTVLEVGVSPSGLVFSAVVLGGSGSKTADQTALDLARTVRFKPLARTGPSSGRDRTALTWGRIIFQWHTAEMPASNRPATGPPP